MKPQTGTFTLLVLLFLALHTVQVIYSTTAALFSIQN